jgi:hypothetical protein
LIGENEESPPKHRRQQPDSFNLYPYLEFLNGFKGVLRNSTEAQETSFQQLRRKTTTALPSKKTFSTVFPQVCGKTQLLK